MGPLLLLFIVVPAVELTLLIEIGKHLGALATLAMIVATGALGATLARRQGLSVFQRVQTELAEGRMPADSMVDGIIILVAGALLLTPGILTDLLGFACLVPAFRAVGKRALWRRFQDRIHTGGGFVVHGGRVIDVEPEDQDRK